MLTATLINLASVMTVTQSQSLYGTLLLKLSKYRAKGAGGWFQVVLSGALCNWAVGMAAFGSAKSRIIISTVAAVFFPVLIFVSLQLEQANAIMSLTMLWLTYSGIYGVYSEGITWGDAFGWLIIPTSLGNTLGAFLLVTLLFSYAFELQRLTWFQKCCAKCRSKKERNDDAPSSRRPGILDFVSGHDTMISLESAPNLNAQKAVPSPRSRTIDV